VTPDISSFQRAVTGRLEDYLLEDWVSDYTRRSDSDYPRLPIAIACG
jgi:hypothetical protein